MAGQHPREPRAAASPSLPGAQALAPPPPPNGRAVPAVCRRQRQRAARSPHRHGSAGRRCLPLGAPRPAPSPPAALLRNERPAGGSGAAARRAAGGREGMADPADRAAHVYGPRSAGRRRNLRQKPNRIAGGSMDRGCGSSPGASGRWAGCAEGAARRLRRSPSHLLVDVTASGAFLERGGPCPPCCPSAAGRAAWGCFKEASRVGEAGRVNRISPWRTGQLVPERERRRRAERSGVTFSSLVFFFFFN